MKRIVQWGFLVLVSLIFSGYVNAKENRWLYIDTDKLQLEVKLGDKTLAVMENIAIGRSGAGFKQKIGDDITPIGSYKISWVNKKSPFYRFYGINYPSKKNADKALSAGLLDKQGHAAIVSAHQNNKIPPQGTRIGGRIGIHGLGKGDERIHEMMNWTHGCIALTNEQIDRLAPWVVDGMVVKIK